MSEFRRSVVEFLRVLADPTRLEILEYLKGNEKPSSEIQIKLNRSQSTTSKHLNMLVDNNLIYYDKKDNIKYYKVKNINIFNLIDRISSMVTDNNKEKFKDVRDQDIYDTLS